MPGELERRWPHKSPEELLGVLQRDMGRISLGAVALFPLPDTEPLQGQRVAMAAYPLKQAAPTANMP